MTKLKKIPTKNAQINLAGSGGMLNFSTKITINPVLIRLLTSEVIAYFPI